MGTKLTPAHRRLLAFLALATVFERYDFFALSEVLELEETARLPL
jgi:hypothetical protein